MHRETPWIPFPTPTNCHLTTPSFIYLLRSLPKTAQKNEEWKLQSVHNRLLFLLLCSPSLSLLQHGILPPQNGILHEWIQCRYPTGCSSSRTASAWFLTMKWSPSGIECSSTCSLSCSSSQTTCYSIRSFLRAAAPAQDMLLRGSPWTVTTFRPHPLLHHELLHRLWDAHIRSVHEEWQ